MRIPFATQSYQSRSLPLSAQRLVNWYPEQAPPDAKTPVALFGTPGLDLWKALPTSPVRGLHVMKGALYVVAGTKAYKVAADGAATELGDVPGISAVQMADNGAQILCLIDSSASGAFLITSTGVSRVTDTDFEGATSVACMDGYFILTKPDSAQFFISSLHDGATYDASEFATAEGDPDNLVGCFVDHRELWLMGTNSIEFWYNSGAADFPFERQSGSYIERGCASIGSVAKLDNTVFWLGDDRVVYRADAYTPSRISTHAIETKLEEYSDFSDVIAFTYTQEGHAFYALKKPGEFTFVYDVATRLWHERQSWQRNDWRISWHAYVYGHHVVADPLTGNLYHLDLHTYDENGDPLLATATSVSIWADANRAFHHSLVLDFEAGVGLTLGQGSDPQAMLQWSNDGGRTWSNEHWCSIGKIGEYRNRAKWNRLGTARQRIYRVGVSDPVKRVFLGAYAEIEGGKL